MLGPRSAGTNIIRLGDCFPPGAAPLLPILEEASGLKGGVDCLVGFSAERIGNKRWSFDGTPTSALLENTFRFEAERAAARDRHRPLNALGFCG